MDWKRFNPTILFGLSLDFNYCLDLLSLDYLYLSYCWPLIEALRCADKDNYPSNPR